MENMEKKTKEMEAKEVGTDQSMEEMAKWINIQTYWYLMQLLKLEVNEAEKIFPQNAELLGEVFKCAASVLEKYGYKVGAPYISTSKDGRQNWPISSEHGDESCGCQDELMEKLFSNIENAVTMSGLKVMDGDYDCIIVRNKKLGIDYEISVKQLEK